MIGWLLIVLGVAIALPQVFSPSPWQAGFALGVVLIVAGVVRLIDREERSHGHRR